MYAGMDSCPENTLGQYSICDTTLAKVTVAKVTLSNKVKTLHKARNDNQLATPLRLEECNKDRHS